MISCEVKHLHIIKWYSGEYYGVTISEGELGILNEVVSVLLLDNGINPGVEFGELVGKVLKLVLGIGVLVEVVSGDSSEEVATKSIMGVDKNSVVIIVVLGGDVLDEELNHVDDVSGGLGGGGSLERSTIGD